MAPDLNRTKNVSDLGGDLKLLLLVCLNFERYYQNLGELPCSEVSTGMFLCWRVQSAPDPGERFQRSVHRLQCASSVVSFRVSAPAAMSGSTTLNTSGVAQVNKS